MPAVRPRGRLRGREREVAAILEELDGLSTGTGCVIIVEGAAGMGKTRLLEEAAVLARERGATVGFAAADPADQGVELSSLIDALFGGAAAPLDRSLLDGRHPDPGERFFAIRDIQADLEQAALCGPLAICVDDLQWVDGGTAAALRSLPAEVATLPIAWIFAVRPPVSAGPVKRALDVLRSAGARVLTASALDDGAIAALAADVLGAVPEQAILDLATETEGSPFLLVELLIGLTEEEQIRVEDGRAHLVAARLPMRVRSGTRDRLSRLSVPAREAVTVAASLGQGFTFAELADTLGWSAAALLGPFNELIGADLLVERGERLSFWHDLTREAVRSVVPKSARRALDRQAAEVLLGRGALPAEVATQLAESAEPGDELAIATLMQASRALVKTDPIAAARFGQRALEISPPNHPSRGEIVTSTAIALHLSGNSENAIAFADAALRDVLPAEQEAEVRLGIAGMFSISPEVRIITGRVALELEDISPRLRARHLAALVHNLFISIWRPSVSSPARLRLGDARVLLSHHRMRSRRALVLGCRLGGCRTSAAPAEATRGGGSSRCAAGDVFRPRLG
jgi:hypothetical protein